MVCPDLLLSDRAGRSVLRYHTPDRRCADDIQQILANRKERRDFLTAPENAKLQQKRAEQVAQVSCAS